MPWTIRYSEQFEEWWDGLSAGQQEALTARIQLLAEHGPNLGRPTVDSVVGTTRHHNMKELRASKGGALRVLFVFDPCVERSSWWVATRPANGTAGTPR
ncbi:MAG: type II toxin-antitoxin system RelE/ParE family toxin [bacterium]